MNTMTNDLKAPYYYCTKNCYYFCTKFKMDCKYPKDYVDSFRNFDKSNFKLVE
jgi:hypothetical protein